MRKIFIFQAIKLYHSLCKEWQGSIPLVFLASKIIKIVRKTRRTNVTVKKNHFSFRNSAAIVSTSGLILDRFIGLKTQKHILQS